MDAVSWAYGVLLLAATFSENEISQPNIAAPVTAISSVLTNEPCTDQDMFLTRFRDEDGGEYEYHTLSTFLVGSRYFLVGSDLGAVWASPGNAFLAENLGLVGRQVLDASEVGECQIVHETARAYPIVVMPTIPRRSVVLLTNSEAEEISIGELGTRVQFEVSWASNSYELQNQAVDYIAIELTQVAEVFAEWNPNMENTSDPRNRDR